MNTIEISYQWGNRAIAFHSNECGRGLRKKGGREKKA